MNTLVKIILQLVLLIITALSELTAQVKIPNRDFDLFEIIRTKNHTYAIPSGWKEHSKNTLWRLEDGHGFAYKYELPDANGSALALHRGSSLSHITETNKIFTSFLVPENKENVRLVGHYKFSGSDIDQTNDTLRIIVFSSEKPVSSIPDEFPKNTKALDISKPQAQFDWFHLDVGEIKGNNYLTIVIQLKSGSDDSYYWGYSNAVIDDLKFVVKHNSL